MMRSLSHRLFLFLLLSFQFFSPLMADPPREGQRSDPHRARRLVYTGAALTLWAASHVGMCYLVCDDPVCVGMFPGPIIPLFTGPIDPCYPGIWPDGNATGQ